MRPLDFKSEGEPTPPRFPDGYLESLTVRQLDALTVVLKHIALDHTMQADLVAIAEHVKSLSPSELASLTITQPEHHFDQFQPHQHNQDERPWDAGGRIYELSLLHPHLTIEDAEARAKREYDEAVLMESDAPVGKWDWNEDQLCDPEDEDEEE